MDEASALPSTWLEQFNGSALQGKLGVSAVLATVDEETWPHISYLGAGEILAQDGGRIALALWPGSKSTANIERTGRAVLHAVADGAIWETRLALQRREPPVEGELAIFDGRVEAVRRHAAPYAEVQGLVAYRLFAPTETLARWTDQVERMRASSSE